MLKNPSAVGRQRSMTGGWKFASGLTAAVTPTASSVRQRSWRRWLTCRPAAAVTMALMALMASTAGAASGFVLTNVDLPGVASSSVVCGDFNNDGRADVLVTGADGSFSGITQVWQNHTNGLFTNLNAALPGLSSSAVARGDFDNDGRLDLLLTGFAGVDGNSFPIYLSQVWRNLGNGTFTNIQAGLPGVNTGAVAPGDFDNDGWLDILLTGYSSTGAVAQVWRNLGHGTFTNLNAGLPGVLYSAAAAGDFDRDGRLDILLTGTPDGFSDTALTQLWRNQGNGTFAKINTAFPGVSLGAVAWGDFDLDGWADVVLTGYASNTAVCQVWRNLGNGGFSNLNAGLPGVYRSAVAVGDYDNDGRLDLAIAGAVSPSNSISQIWRNTGNGGFTPLNAGLPGLRSGSVAWADLNNDGRLDLLLAGLDNTDTPVLQVYRNDTAAGSAARPRISGLRFPGEPSPLLSFAGATGFGYTVWASTNLVQWSALGAANEVGVGTFQFSDRTAVRPDARFYRLSRP